MAEALLRRSLDELGVTDVAVTSAGTRALATGATEEARVAAAERGGVLDGHRATRVDAGLVEGADLVIAMTADHVIDLVYEAPECAERVFKLAELARRVAEVGARGDEEALEQYVARLAQGRSEKPWVDSRLDRDVPDPMGDPLEEYRRIVAVIDELLESVVEHMWPAD